MQHTPSPKNHPLSEVTWLAVLQGLRSLTAST